MLATLYTMRGFLIAVPDGTPGVCSMVEIVEETIRRSRTAITAAEGRADGRQVENIKNF